MVISIIIAALGLAGALLGSALIDPGPRGADTGIADWSCGKIRAENRGTTICCGSSLLTYGRRVTSGCP